MTYDEILDLFTDKSRDSIFNFQEDLNIEKLDKIEECVLIGDCGVFPVYGVKSSMDRNNRSIDVFTSTGADIGSLIFTKNLLVDTFENLTLQEFYAYLIDVPVDKFGVLEYTISSDYFISSPNLADQYISDFYDSAPIWGGYTHYPPPNIIETPVAIITAIPRIVSPSSHHIEAFSRYIHADNPLERYLRLYHCIELLFDAVTVLRIKALSNDIRGLSEILSDHDATELGRLQMISKEFIYDSEKLASSFCALTAHSVISQKIFQTHSKKGNPVNPDGDSTKWDKLITELRSGKFTETEWKTSNFLKPNEDYTLTVSKLASYWIYRVRCSIAHSRIGEYILEDSDQQFIVDFAEPMLLEFCVQVFTSQSLIDLL